MKILLTWWTHSWKTSILEYLSKNGFCTLWEVAWDNMKLLIDVLWLEWYRKWRNKNLDKLLEMYIYSNLKRDLNISNLNKLTFYDRWVFDWIASFKRESIMIPDYIFDLVENIKYDYIFIIENLPYHNTRESTWRMLDQEKSNKWKKFIINEYEQRFWNDKVIIVPYFNLNKEESIEKRAQFILDYIDNIYKK